MRIAALLTLLVLLDSATALAQSAGEDEDEPTARVTLYPLGLRGPEAMDAARALRSLRTRAERCVPEDDHRAWTFRLTLVDGLLRVVADHEGPAATGGASAGRIGRCLRRALQRLRLSAERHTSFEVMITRRRQAFGGLGLLGATDGVGGGGALGGLQRGEEEERHLTEGEGTPADDDDDERRVPVIRQGPVTVGPALSRELIRRVIRQHQTEVQSCYERELARDPDLEGRLMVRFRIRPDGRVDEAEVTSSTLAGDAVGRCLTRRVRRWRFPEPNGGGVIVVNYPFVLRSPDGDESTDERPDEEAR